MVGMPARHLRERLGADRTGAALLFPEVGQESSSSQGFFHLYAKAFFKIGFPCGIVRVTGSFHFGVSGYRGGRGMGKSMCPPFSVFVLYCPADVPVSVARPLEVAVANPPRGLLRVPPFCPSPQRVENGRIHMDKGVLCRSMAVKVGPASYCGVEESDESVCRGLFVSPDDFSDVCKKRVHVRLRRTSQKLPVILARLLSEEVTSVLDVRYPGLLFRAFQPSFLEACHEEGFDFRFQYLFRVPSNNEV